MTIFLHKGLLCLTDSAHTPEITSVRYASDVSDFATPTFLIFREAIAFLGRSNSSNTGDCPHARLLTRILAPLQTN